MAKTNGVDYEYFEATKNRAGTYGHLRIGIDSVSCFGQERRARQKLRAAKRLRQKKTLVVKPGVAFRFAELLGEKRPASIRAAKKEDEDGQLTKGLTHGGKKLESNAKSHKPSK